MRRVFVANRGEIALRIVRACRDNGLESVVGVSEADRESMAARLADATVCIGPASSAASYLNVPAIVTAARGTGCDAVHPGYGFLAENPGLAEMCGAQGLTFIGPPADAIRAMGNKVAARALATKRGIPVLPSVTVTASSAITPDAIGADFAYPILIKSASGGGGRGLRRVDHPEQLSPSLAQAMAEADAAFGDDTVYIEPFIVSARHVEIQVAADRHGHAVHLHERDCTVQRRYQKLLEETPSPVVADHQRADMAEAALALIEGLGYEGVGTVEFLYDAESGRFYFMEMNTRLQVEHPVTEMTTGVDLVTVQLIAAAGGELGLAQRDITPRGHAMEFRINAEDPDQDFAPRTGMISEWHAPAGPWLRVDSHIHVGSTVSPFYDSLLAKVVVSGADRDETMRRARRALDEFVVAGVPTTLPVHRWILRQHEFEKGSIDTMWLTRRWNGSPDD